MGKVIVLISTTLDGFADAENVIVDPEFFEFTHSLMSIADVAAFGRNTFEIFQGRWPQRLHDSNAPDWIRKMAQSLHNIPKIVFSSTLKHITWENSSIINKLDADYIKAFKRERSGALLTFGSLSLIESLTKMNVVDDYYFNIQPIIPGKGQARLFGNTNFNEALPLKYVECKELKSGAL